MRLVDFAHKEIGAVLRPGDLAIDATVGNGLDTLFLARTVGPSGIVYGFDIQAEAITVARERLAAEGIESRVTLVLANHAEIEGYLANEHRNRIKAVMFNLGYLPGGNKTIITSPQSTCIALQSACTHLAKGGRITVLCYTGHPGGQMETDAVKRMIAGLPGEFRSTTHRPETVSKAPPELVVIERVA